ncbi:anaerobic selenocysteine-containing dehydrogenase [Kitasatospora sp. GP30]|nr:anaerobic selenocysteine-containing dehydrogenase [Kitasatospora sp. GP30]
MTTTTPVATATHCPCCSLQCGMLLAPTAIGSAVPVEVRERAGFPVNRGALCGKGRNAAALLAPGVRLSTPLVRTDGGELRAATWAEALDRVAAGLAAIRAEHGADAVGVFGGGLTNEKAYQLGKFARVALGTATIDYNGWFCMSSAAAAGRLAFGLDRGLPFPLADIPHTDCLILVGANPAETMPPAAALLPRTARERRHLDRGGPALHRRRRPGRSAPAARAGHRSGVGAGSSTRPSATSSPTSTRSWTCCA